MKTMHTFSAALAFAGMLSWTAISRAQVGLETPGGVRDSSEAGGTSVRVGRDIDSGTVTPDITGAAASSPQIRERLQEDSAERQLLQQDRMEDRVTIPRGTVGSYDLSAGAAAGGDSWRFKFYNNHWWYWQPNNTWAVYYRDQWIPYSAGTYAQYFPNTLQNGGANGMYGSPRRYRSAYRGGGPGLSTAPTNSGLRNGSGARPVPSDGYNGYRGTLQQNGGAGVGRSLDNAPSRASGVGPATAGAGSRGAAGAGGGAGAPAGGAAGASAGGVAGSGAGAGGGAGGSAGGGGK